MKSIVLGIETSCDESSIALVENGTKPIKEATASQVKLMAKYGGVVPELSARKHLEALPILYQELFEANEEYLKRITAVAVTVNPGLPPALATGTAFARGVSLGLDVPLIETDHLQAHLCSVLIDDPPPDNAPINFAKTVDFPNITLLVSGGHTSIFLVESPLNYTTVGQTRDDAAGESFDKVSRIIGLGYPGGPMIQKYAEQAVLTPQTKWQLAENPFPTPLSDDPFNFSFSGLKTAARRLILELGKKHGLKIPKDTEIEKVGSALPERLKQEIAYYFQERVVETLAQKSVNAAIENKIKMVVLTGGVAANKRLRERLSQICEDNQLYVKYPLINRCTDNATMVASAGYYLL